MSMVKRVRRSRSVSVCTGEVLIAVASLTDLEDEGTLSHRTRDHSHLNTLGRAVSREVPKGVVDSVAILSDPSGTTGLELV